MSVMHKIPHPNSPSKSISPPINLSYIPTMSEQQEVACSAVDANEEEKKKKNRSNHPLHILENLASFKLRAQLCLLPFYSHIWSVMPALKWKYEKTDGVYISPNGIRFASSKEALETLDELSLKSEGIGLYIDRHDEDDLSENLHTLKAYWKRHQCNNNISIVNPDDSTSNVSFEEWLDKLQTTRDQLLEAIFYNHLETRKDESSSVIVDVLNDSSKPRPPTLFTLDNIEDDDMTSDKHASSSSRTRTDKRATSIDAGAEQYFTKKTKRMKRKSTSPSTDVHLDQSTKNDNNVSTTLLTSSSRAEENTTKISTFQKVSKVALLDPQECVLKLLSKVQSHSVSDESEDEFYHKREKELYHSQFKEWSFLLSTHHSILLYGFGSKRFLLQNFAQLELSKHGHVLSLHGYDKDISLDGILNVLVQSFLDGVEPAIDPREETHPSPFRRVVTISKALANQRPCLPIYLVIHNIDGISLRDSTVQDALSLLVSCSQVHASARGVIREESLHLEPQRVVRLIASIDHLNASAILWKAETELNFKWVWKLVHTHRPYYDEVLQSVSDTNRKSKASQNHGTDMLFMERVIRSIAPRHAEIVHQLAEMQLEKVSQTGTNASFVEYKALKKTCTEKMIISKESEFQSMIKELMDHGIVECKNDDKTYKDLVGIPIDKSQLRDILDFTKAKK